MPMLGSWQNFYVMVGSATGALIGLQFVAVTLVASQPSFRQQFEAGAAFSTPIIFHFAIVLFLSALALIPWVRPWALSILWGAAGLGGILFTARVPRHMLRATEVYQPVPEDWLCHVLLPMVSYVLFLAAAATRFSSPRVSPFLAAAGILLLLFTGVHNTWDAVSYHIFQRSDEPEDRPGHERQAG